MEIVVEYISEIIIVVAALIAYHLGGRKKKLERFYIQSEDSLFNHCAPMYYHLEDIYSSKSFKNISDFDQFFDLFSSRSNQIVKLGNRELVERFLKVERNYHKYHVQIVKDNNLLEDILVDLFTLKVDLEKEHWKNFNSVYGDFRWYQFTLNQNYLVRVSLEVYRQLRELLVFIVYLTVFSFLVYLSCKINKTEVPELLTNIILLFIILISILSFLVYFVEFFIRSRYKQNSTKFMKFVKNNLMKYEKNKLVGFFLKGDKEMVNREVAMKALNLKGGEK